jgi:hypothetical protein
MSRRKPRDYRSLRRGHGHASIVAVGSVRWELRDAQMTIRRSHHIYKALTEGTSLIAEKANVENLNYLQCSWSLTNVYSNQKNFSFARHVFLKSPQYRNAVRTSVLEKGRIFIPVEDT